MVFTIANLRGGAGKTTTTLYLAKILSEAGSKVLIADLDPQTSIGILLNMDLAKLAKYNIMTALQNKKIVNKCIYKITDNFHVLPSYMSLQDFDRIFMRVISPELLLKDIISGLKYDYIFVDTPPAFSTLTKNAIMAADKLIIPVDPHILSLEGASRLINNIDEIMETSPSRKEINIRKFYILPTQQKKFRAGFQKEFLKTLHNTFVYNDIIVLPAISVYDSLREKQTHFDFLTGKILDEYRKAVQEIVKNG